MIYDKDIPKTLEQGDILKNIPKITPNQINFDHIKDYWKNTFQSKTLPTKGTFQVKPILSSGVILSQSCDIRPGFAILFAELKNIPENKLSSSPKKRIENIKKIIRDDTRIHYFPPDNEIELFKEPKLLDFKNLFFIPFEFFQDNIQYFFIGRLKSYALKILIDKISRFFTRLAYEDVMFLSGDEISQYLNELSEEERIIAVNTIKEFSE